MKSSGKYVLWFLVCIWLSPSFTFSQVENSNEATELDFPDKFEMSRGERFDILFNRGFLLSSSMHSDSVPINTGRSGTSQFGIGLNFAIGSVLSFRVEPSLIWHNIDYKQEDAKRFPTDSAKFDLEKHRSFYIGLPIAFRLNLARNYDGKPVFYVDLGASAAYLLGTMYKRRSEVNGSQYIEKLKNIPDFETFRLGAFARIGTKRVALYGHYRFSNIFREDAEYSHPNRGTAVDYVKFNPIEIGISILL